MTKDRLAELQAFGGLTATVVEDVENGGPRVDLSLDHVAINMAMDNPFDEFFDQFEDIRAKCDELQGIVKELSSRHNELIAATVETDKMKEELDQLMSDAKRLASTIKEKLQRLENSLDYTTTGENPNSAMHRMRKHQHATLTRAFLNIMEEFSACQADYNDKVKSKLKRQLEIMDENLTSEEIDAKLESGDLAVFTQGLIAETEQAKENMKAIESRHKDIVKLEQSIRELAEMFKDLEMLVSSQGELIDRIEHNVENTEDYIVSANVQLKKAREHQTSSRKKCIILVVCIIVLIGIVLAIVLSQVL